MSDQSGWVHIRDINTFIAGENIAVRVKNTTNFVIDTGLSFVNIPDDGRGLAAKRTGKSIEILSRVTLGYAAGYDITFPVILRAKNLSLPDKEAAISLVELKVFIADKLNDEHFYFDSLNLLSSSEEAVEILVRTEAVMRFLETNEMIGYVHEPCSDKENDTGYISRRVTVNDTGVGLILTELHDQLWVGDTKKNCLKLKPQLLKDMKEQVKLAALKVLSATPIDQQGQS